MSTSSIRAPFEVSLSAAITRTPLPDLPHTATAELRMCGVRQQGNPVRLLDPQLRRALELPAVEAT